MKIAYIIVTNTRLKQANAQMDLIKNIYSKNPKLAEIDIYHAYNGDLSEDEIKYKEFKLVKIKNRGKYLGACDLTNAGMLAVFESGIEYDFIFVASADVLFVNSDLILKTLNEMNDFSKSLATSVWFSPKAYATEFFIIKPSAAKKVFPLDLEDYMKSHKIIDLYSRSPLNSTIVELAFYEQFHKVLSGDGVLLIEGRKFVHNLNHRNSERIKYFSPHDMSEFEKVVSRFGIH